MVAISDGAQEFGIQMPTLDQIGTLKKDQQKKMNIYSLEYNKFTSHFIQIGFPCINVGQTVLCFNVN